jgi:hypothetical protein
MTDDTQIARLLPSQSARCPAKNAPRHPPTYELAVFKDVVAVVSVKYDLYDGITFKLPIRELS